MELMCAGLLLLLFSSAYTYQISSKSGDGSFVQDPELEWEKVEAEMGEEMALAPAPKVKSSKSKSYSLTTMPEALRVPLYVTVSAAEDQKELFKPEKGYRYLPHSVRQRLLGAFQLDTSPPIRDRLVEILCPFDRMYVRIRRELFKTRNAHKDLKLGTCPVNFGSPDHFYFLYLLTNDCGFRKESNVNELSIHNVLHYTPSGPVLRELPIDLPLQCNYHRLFHSYKVGFHPTLQGGTVFKALSERNFALTIEDASGGKIIGIKTYNLGEPMFFQASKASSTASYGNQRTYINKCFITASYNPNSYPKHTIIDNQGCMIDGKVTDNSRFFTGPSKMIQRFSVTAMIFRASPPAQQLYMHCEITAGPLTPTPSAKACNYDPATRRWKELYGDDTVCTCCDYTCSVVKRTSRKMISSHSWKVSKAGDVDAALGLQSDTSDAALGLQSDTSDAALGLQSDTSDAALGLQSDTSDAALGLQSDTSDAALGLQSDTSIMDDPDVAKD